jgi:Arc/MetJ family transcription regulator
MRTTIDIDDQLLKYVKQQAAQQGCTVKQIIEDALREALSYRGQQIKPIKLETVAGAGLKPGVNLDDGRSLNDIMDGR